MVNKKISTYITAGLLLFGVVSGLGAYKAFAAVGPSPVGSSPVVQADTAQRQEQNQAYNSSVKVDNQKDTADVEGKDNEPAESKSLQSLAKITAEDAKASALKAVSGKVADVSLDNENGNVVYSVKVQTANGVSEVKVDAGNGSVLTLENQKDSKNGQDNSASETENENDNGQDSDKTENDNNNETGQVDGAAESGQVIQP